ncbi:MAG: MOSC domain-containing protein [Xanthomonadales bacterium]|nr:MOSC domain-containing protein [Xanthomonadales bacterium]
MSWSLDELRRQSVRPGNVTWIGLRPDRKLPMTVVESVMANPKFGLEGDRYAGRSGKRQVTLIDQAHLQAVAGYLCRTQVDPGLVRRNIVVSGLNLRALKEGRFRIGEALLEYTDECHPCSRMEEALGTGGYNAMRGHGGICARVLQAGVIRLNDPVSPVEAGT